MWRAPVKDGVVDNTTRRRRRAEWMPLGLPGHISESRDCTSEAKDHDPLPTSSWNGCRLGVVTLRNLEADIHGMSRGYMVVKRDMEDNDCVDVIASGDEENKTPRKLYAVISISRSSMAVPPTHSRLQNNLASINLCLCRGEENTYPTFHQPWDSQRTMLARTALTPPKPVSMAPRKHSW